MKLSKKGAAVQQAIHDALASGKALGGLLVGFAATVAGCGERHTQNEDAKVFVTEGEIPEPEETPAQEQEPSKTNAVQEQQCEKVIRGRIVPPVTTNAVNEADDEAVVMGGVGGDS